MKIRCIARVGSLVLIGLLGTTLGADDRPGRSIMQFGEMHEAIGQGKHEGRIRLGDLTKRANLYAVAALAGLEGELTVRDREITATVVDESGHLKSVNGSLDDVKATLLAGAYVPEWTEVIVAKDVAPDEFDGFVAAMAKEVGVSTGEPFVFTVDGKLANVRMHVINGACPIRARMKKIQLPKQQQPYEKDISEVRGTVVAIFAKDQVGKLTHPATTTHAHILYRDPSTDKTVTGHLEAVGLRKGAVLKLPKR